MAPLWLLTIPINNHDCPRSSYFINQAHSSGTDNDHLPKTHNVALIMQHTVIRVTSIMPLNHFYEIKTSN